MNNRKFTPERITSLAENEISLDENADKYNITLIPHTCNRLKGIKS